MTSHLKVYTQIFVISIFIKSSNFGKCKTVSLQNNINGFAYITDQDIRPGSVIIANTYAPNDNTRVLSVTIGGSGLAVVWFSTFNTDTYTVRYRVFN